MRRANANAGKAMLGDRRVDHALGAEFLKQALGNLVGALVFGDFLAHEEDVLIGAHFLGHRVAQASRTVVGTISVPSGISGIGGGGVATGAAGTRSGRGLASCFGACAAGSGAGSAELGRSDVRGAFAVFAAARRSRR
jgi:hypothetical protein